MHWLLLILWTTPHAILIFCVIGLVRHSRFKTLPFFFTYVIYEEVLFSVLLPVVFWIGYWGGPKALYQWITVVGSVGISSCLQLAVFYEIVNTLILPQSPTLAALRPLIRWATATTLLLAVGISAALSSAGLRPLNHIFEVLNFSTNLVNLSLLMVLLLFTRTLRISWRSLPTGIVLGFGINSSAEIAATSLVSAFGMNGIVSKDIIRMLAFIACTVVWLIYILLPEKTPQFTGPGVQKSEIESWNEEMQKIVEP